MPQGGYSPWGSALSEAGDFLGSHFAYLDQVKERQRELREARAAREAELAAAEARDDKRARENQQAIAQRAIDDDLRAEQARQMARDEREAENKRVHQEKLDDAAAAAAAKRQQLQADADLIVDPAAKARFLASEGRVAPPETAFQTPEQTAQEYRQQTGQMAERETATTLARRRAEQRTPITPALTSDEITFPPEVRQLVSNIALRAQSAPPQVSQDPLKPAPSAAMLAHSELQRSLVEMQAKYPRLDVTRANSTLMSMLGTSVAGMNAPPKDDLTALLGGAGGAPESAAAVPVPPQPRGPLYGQDIALPASQPPAPMPGVGRGAIGQPPITARPPAGRGPAPAPHPPSPDPEAEAQGLLSEYRKTTDPAQKQVLKDRILFLRTQHKGGG